MTADEKPVAGKSAPPEPVQESLAQGDLLASPALLAKIDKLRERNIGKHVALPQLVVVGDQSSGKSSLLESLTGIPFPRDVELCTRYATQITQRRDDTSHVDITIIAGVNSSPEHKSNVEGYHASAQSGDDLRLKFPSILREVNVRMGIRTNPQAKGGKVFTEDILKIEICGPRADYLTVIDVPGIFRNPTEGITTKDDMALVRNMVIDYIKDTRTIILAVLPCNVDIANQEILTLAEEYDKKGERTLGILTKPDLVPEPSAKDTICSIVEAKKKQLTLGYYVVRSRGADQDDEGYGSRESMFLVKPWSRLPRARVGVQALRARLGELLGVMAKREFPKMRKDVNDMLRKVEEERDNLGPSRKDEYEQRVFLSSIAGKFQDLVRAGLEAQYTHHPVFDDSKLRLITQVVGLTDVFNHDFTRKAALRNFINRSSQGTELDFPRINFSGNILEEFPELDDIIKCDHEAQYPLDGIMGWIKDLYLSSRGMGLGAVSDVVLASAWREQSKKWPDITHAFMSKIIASIHRFLTSALELCCTDSSVREALWDTLQEDVLLRYKSTISFLNYLLAVERDNKPYTLNRFFNQSRQEAHANRVADNLRDVATTQGCGGSLIKPDDYRVSLAQIKKSTQTKSNLEDVAERLHDDLYSYYEVAQKRFIDNVWTQVVSHRLLDGPETPLNVFTQEWVISLSSEQLKMIAGESASVREQRLMLDRKIEDLKEAKKILT